MDKFFKPTRRGNPLLRKVVGGFGPSGDMTTDQAQIANGRPPVDIPRTRGLTFPRTVKNVSGELQPVDNDRRFLFMQNNDPLGNVYVSFGADAKLLQGMKMAAGGGGIFMDNNVPTAAITAIGDIALNPNITIITA